MSREVRDVERVEETYVSFLPSGEENETFFSTEGVGTTLLRISGLVLLLERFRSRTGSVSRQGY